MRKTISIGLVALVVFLAGCASAPEPEPVSEPAPESERNAAVVLRTVAERSGFGTEMPQEFGAAETAFAQAEELYEPEPQQARELYLAAADGYRLVIREGSSRRSGRYRGEVQNNREEAVSVRADVAQRELFEKAEEDRDRAEALLEEEEYEEAFEAFQASRDGFAEAHRLARAQRQRALRSLSDLDSTLDERQRRIEELQGELEADDAQ